MGNILVRVSLVLPVILYFPVVCRLVSCKLIFVYTLALFSFELGGPDGQAMVARKWEI